MEKGQRQENDGTGAEPPLHPGPQTAQVFREVSWFGGSTRYVRVRCSCGPGARHGIDLLFTPCSPGPVPLVPYICPASAFCVVQTACQEPSEQLAVLLASACTAKDHIGGGRGKVLVDGPRRCSHTKGTPTTPTHCDRETDNHIDQTTLSVYLSTGTTDQQHLDRWRHSAV